jgi:multisubunit Na+/H+ antiporter MnhG subunit
MWAGIAAVIGLILLLLGLTVSDGVVAGVEIVLAILLLVASYALQRAARRQSVYRDRPG